jgi:ribose-phosphate pyrophosphokinase
MIIIGGTASKCIAEDLSKELNVSMAKTDSKRFPDGEFYVRILDEISNEEVVIVQTTYPDENIIELLILQNAVKEANAKGITVVIPYFGYARQDTKFKDGEPISAKAMAEIIGLNADKIITVDPHKEHILDFFSTKAYSCSAIPEIAKYLKDKNVDMILAPDKGALVRAREASMIIGCDFDYMEKTRIDGETIQIKPKKLDAHNKNVAIIDDIISTGGTMAQSINHLKQHGAKKIMVACTHGLFAGKAINKLKTSGDVEIIATDTIKGPYSKVKISPVLSPFFNNY